MPTLHDIAPDRDAYVAPKTLRVLKRHAVRHWTFRGQPTTLELSGRRFVKSLDAFSEHASDSEAFYEMLREYADYGVPRPTGYADPFHARFQTPRVKWTYNAILASRFVGGWQEAIAPGTHLGPHYRYDLRSAYLWAGSLGLPDVASYAFSRKIGALPGVYRITLAHSVEGAPYPFNYATDVLASTEEIDLYSLPVAQVHGGVTWRALADPAPMLAVVRDLSTWKAAGRMYWGRWAQTTRVECHTDAKSWPLPNVNVNIPWAHMIVSRVKAKTWLAARDAVHVYVDSVITPRPLGKSALGPRIGDWKLEHIYTDGVQILAPGWYGAAGDTRLEKMAGVRYSDREKFDIRARLDKFPRIKRGDWHNDADFSLAAVA